MARAGRIVVAGAGALGLASALALARAGFAVTLCDPGEPDAGASGVAAGMFAPAFEAALDGVGEAQLGLLLAARDLWPALEAGAGVRLDRSGALAVGSPHWLAEVRSAFTRLGLYATELPRRALDDLAPGLSPAFASGLMTREDWRLEPRAALAALRRAADAAGVQVRREAVVGRGDADVLVVATGAGQGLAGIVPELALLTPIKGHILRAAGVAASLLSVRGEGVYAVPAQGGLAIGATMEPGISDPAVDPGQVAALRATGAALAPALADAAVEAFAGVRAATPDGLPMAGFSQAPGVILATGARRNGWLLAPLVAQAVAACVTGGDAGRHAASLDPARFRAAAGPNPA